MPDVYASIESADEAIQERLAEVLELRAADAVQQAMLGHIAYASLIGRRP
jgi:hypothetical protein